MAVGEITCRECSYFEWKIDNYLTLSQKADTSYRSPSFNCLEETWYLEIYPNGQRSESSVGWISVYLYRETCIQQSNYVRYTIGLKEACGIKSVAYDRSTTFRRPLTNSDRVLNFLERSEVLSNMDAILANGCLTIFCLMDVPTKGCIDCSCQTELSENISYKPKHQVESLLGNMKELFLSEKKCDTTIEVKGQEFHAHKIILAAQSPIFSAMFEHKMKENLSVIVSITDADPDLFHDILLYMYCGEVENLCSDNAAEYYKIANKHSLMELKEKCSKLMESSISISNACDVFLFADVHNEIKLKEQAKDFIIKNAITILASNNWKSFSRENNLISIQILEMVVTNSASLKK